MGNKLMFRLYNDEVVRTRLPHLSPGAAGVTPPAAKAGNIDSSRFRQQIFYDMEAEVFTMENKDILMEYELLAKLRSDGNRDYHKLSATHITCNSLLITAIALFIGGNFNSTICNNISLKDLFGLILCLIGVLLCIQMYSAQAIFRAKNRTCEAILRDLEDSTESDKIKYFNQIKNTMDRGYRINSDDSIDPRSRLERVVIKKHGAFIISRMKLFPYIFCLIYLLLACVIFINMKQSLCIKLIITTIVIIMITAIVGYFIVKINRISNEINKNINSHQGENRTRR